MTRIVVSSSLDVIADGVVVSWDEQQENGIARIAGVEYSIFQSYDGDGYIALYDADADTFIRRLNEAVTPDIITRVASRLR